MLEPGTVVKIGEKPKYEPPLSANAAVANVLSRIWTWKVWAVPPARPAGNTKLLIEVNRPTVTLKLVVLTSANDEAELPA
jgi:hypothetical protein